jgi:aa3 type cytochrome c oxidase subunit IV
MAAHGEQSDSGDLGEHIKTWIGFTTFIKWSIAGAGLIMALLAIFRTNG